MATTSRSRANLSPQPRPKREREKSTTLKRKKPNKETPENLIKSRGSSDLGSNAVVELIGQEFDVGISQDASGWPRDARIPNWPDLRHQGRDAGRELPAANDSRGDGRTHDVNDEMLAEENGRGLRVRFMNRIRCNNLGFLFGE